MTARRLFIAKRAGSLRSEDQERFAKLYAQGLKYTLLIMTPLILIVVLFAGNMLAIWVGNDFAAKGTLVLQPPVLGMLLEGVSVLPRILLDASGRPDIRAKGLLALVIPFVILLFVFTKQFGVNGTAASWLLKEGAEALVFLWVAHRVAPQTVTAFRESDVWPTVLLATGSMVAASGVLLAFGDNLVAKTFACLLLHTLFLAAAWKYVLDGAVKDYVFAVLRWG